MTPISPQPSVAQRRPLRPVGMGVSFRQTVIRPLRAEANRTLAYPLPMLTPRFPPDTMLAETRRQRNPQDGGRQPETFIVIGTADRLNCCDAVAA